MVSGEDADPARADQETDHDQHNTPDHLLPDDREDAGDHQDDRHDPQHRCQRYDGSSLQFVAPGARIRWRSIRPIHEL
jgi:hypothetical protein